MRRRGRAAAVTISQSNLRTRRRKRSTKISKLSAVLRLSVLFLFVFTATLWIMLHMLAPTDGLHKAGGEENSTQTQKLSEPPIPIQVKQLLQEVHPQPPRKMSSTKNPIYFMHVGKTGMV